MSLILDALNRSRQDTEQMPGLSSIHPVEEVQSETHWLLWLMAAILAVALLAIAWLLFDRQPQQASTSHPQAVEQAGARGAAVKKPAPMISGTASERAPAAPTAARKKPEPKPATTLAPSREASSVSEPVARGENTGQTPVPVSPPVPRAAVQPSVAPAVAQSRPEPVPEPVDKGVAALYQQRQQSQASAQRAQRAAPSRLPPVTASRVEESLDIAQLVTQAEAELRDARIAEHEVPMLSTMSQQTKDAIPTLMYQQHDYSGDPARSSVIINGKTLRAGGSAGGVKVEEILPDSVVLEVSGTRFRLRALNSWVNL